MHAGITLRDGLGSHRIVEEVLGYDAIGGVAFLRFKRRFASEPITSERVPLSRLEALDANGWYVHDVASVVRSMCDIELIFE